MKSKTSTRRVRDAGGFKMRRVAKVVPLLSFIGISTVHPSSAQDLRLVDDVNAPGSAGAAANDDDELVFVFGRPDRRRSLYEKGGGAQIVRPLYREDRSRSGGSTNGSSGRSDRGGKSGKVKCLDASHTHKLFVPKSGKSENGSGKAGKSGNDDGIRARRGLGKSDKASKSGKGSKSGKSSGHSHEAGKSKSSKRYYHICDDEGARTSSTDGANENIKDDGALVQHGTDAPDTMDDASSSTESPNTSTSSMIPAGTGSVSPLSASSPAPSANSDSSGPTDVPSTSRPTTNAASTSRPTTSPNKNPTTEAPTAPPTTEPPTASPTCNPFDDFDLCIAIDGSGSVCSTAGKRDCLSCLPAVFCQDPGIASDTCCENFATVKEFSSETVEALTELPGENFFSVVKFASDATIDSELSLSEETVRALRDMEYSGGATNHALAIEKCAQTLLASSASSRANGDGSGEKKQFIKEYGRDVYREREKKLLRQTDVAARKRKKFILLITDGTSTLPKPDPEAAALAASNSVKEDGVTVIPVFISATQDQDAIEYMSGLSSSGNVFDVSDFESLLAIRESLVNEVACLDGL